MNTSQTSDTHNRGLLATRILNGWSLSSSTAVPGTEVTTTEPAAGLGPSATADLTASTVTPVDILRYQVLEIITRKPGLDAEEIAELLGVPLLEVSDRVAQMCSEGILAPAE